MLTAIGAAFGLVFVAELGDRTQLIVLTAGARGGTIRTLGVIAVAIAIVQAVGAGAGALIGDVMSDRAAAALSAVLFAGFSVWTWRDADDDDDDDPRAAPLSAWRLGLALGLAELGDKSMLAGATLAAANNPIGTWIGATAAEVVVSALGLVAGRALAARIDHNTLQRAGAIAFAAAAAFSVFEFVTA